MSLTIYCISKTGTNEVYISDIRPCQHVELVNNEIEICHIRREFIEYGNENMTQTKDSVPYRTISSHSNIWVEFRNRQSGKRCWSKSIMVSFIDIFLRFISKYHSIWAAEGKPNHSKILIMTNASEKIFIQLTKKKIKKIQNLSVCPPVVLIVQYCQRLDAHKGH